VNGKIIVFDGTDSSGKRTQAMLLTERLNKEGCKAKMISFPRYEHFFGKVVGRYLMGEFGSKEVLPPEFAALLYAVDRYNLKNEIESKLKEGVVLVMDRYIEANLYHAAKYKEGVEREEFIEWLEKVEERLPQADKVFFLDMPSEAAQKLMQGEDRSASYRKGKTMDIHESDLNYQEQVKKTFLSQAKKKNWEIIKCAEKKDSGWEIFSKKKIHEMIWAKVKELVECKQ
jgi:dTMP kinase